jgi:peptidyl-prolyl cis-trans isomerase B (cyclophilin B)
VALARGLSLAAAALLLAGCGGGTKESAGTTTVAPPAAVTPPTPCAKAAAPSPKPDGGRRKPKTPLDPVKIYRAVVQTSCGSFTITLDVRHSPHATASFVALARSHFFDGLTFHRIVPGFVIQGGDPTGTGGGGPGYLTVDPPPASARYVHGVVAMAKTEAQPAGTSGSQFFVVTGADARLPPQYALLGRVTSGLPVVDQIGKLGDPATPMPTQVVLIRRITILQS